MGSSEIKLFEPDYEAIMRELKEYAEKTVKRGALAVILIGSLARGDYTAFSDADVIIVVEESSERPIDRIIKYLEPSASVDIEPRVYSTKEIQAMAKRRARIIKEIIEHGILLSGNKEIIEEIRQAIKTES